MKAIWIYYEESGIPKAEAETNLANKIGDNSTSLGVPPVYQLELNSKIIMKH